jgi:hypothetical protein
MGGIIFLLFILIIGIAVLMLNISKKVYKMYFTLFPSEISDDKSIFIGNKLTKQQKINLDPKFEHTVALLDMVKNENWDYTIDDRINLEITFKKGDRELIIRLYLNEKTAKLSRLRFRSENPKIFSSQTEDDFNLEMINKIINFVYYYVDIENKKKIEKEENDLLENHNKMKKVLTGHYRDKNLDNLIN